MGNKKAVILLSGGLDSSTVLFWAKKKGFTPLPLVFDYGQRHKREIEAAERIARYAGLSCRKVVIRMPWKGSALLDTRMPVPEKLGRGIPSTYVPARNIIFLSFAASCAEAEGAGRVLLGVNAVDFSGYPDCRPKFIKAMQSALSAGMKNGVSGKPVKIIAPLINMSKAEIIRLGMKLGVPYELTSSCYKGGERPCGKCDSCRLRAKGFKEAGLSDPLDKVNKWLKLK